MSSCRDGGCWAWLEGMQLFRCVYGVWGHNCGVQSQRPPKGDTTGVFKYKVSKLDPKGGCREA